MVTCEYKVVFVTPTSEFALTEFGMQFKEFFIADNLKSINVEAEDYCVKEIIGLASQFFDVENIGMIQQVVTYEPDWEKFTQHE